MARGAGLRAPGGDRLRQPLQRRRAQGQGGDRRRAPGAAHLRGHALEVVALPGLLRRGRPPRLAGHLGHGRRGLAGQPGDPRPGPAAVVHGPGQDGAGPDAHLLPPHRDGGRLPGLAGLRERGLGPDRDDDHGVGGPGAAIEVHGSNGTIGLYDRGIGAWHFRTRRGRGGAGVRARLGGADDGSGGGGGAGDADAVGAAAAGGAPDEHHRGRRLRPDPRYAPGLPARGGAEVGGHPGGGLPLGPAGGAEESVEY